MPDGGLILALGWPGQWSAAFTRDTENTVHAVAGQERTHFKLLPGGRGPLAAGGAAILQRRRLRPRPKCLATMDGGAQPAAARRQTGPDPLRLLLERDPQSDRQGLTEIRHVEGYLAFWDEILRRHPNLYIDTCASGGNRNDLETLRRSVPLLRSDCFTPAEAQQAHTMGLALWMPYFGSGMGPGDVYWYRSCIFPASRIGMDTRKKDQDYALLKKMMAEFHEVEKYLLGDFYPLTAHGVALDVWVAWQFDRPELGEGIIQAFRRDESPYETARFKLRGLDPDAHYRASRTSTSPSP